LENRQLQWSIEDDLYPTARHGPRWLEMDVLWVGRVLLVFFRVQSSYTAPAKTSAVHKEKGGGTHHKHDKWYTYKVMQD